MEADVGNMIVDALLSCGEGFFLGDQVSLFLFDGGLFVCDLRSEFDFAIVLFFDLMIEMVELLLVFVHHHFCQLDAFLLIVFLGLIIYFGLFRLFLQALHVFLNLEKQVIHPLQVGIRIFELL